MVAAIAVTSISVEVSATAAENFKKCCPWHWAANGYTRIRGEFGASPLHGQLSGKQSV